MERNRVIIERERNQKQTQQELQHQDTQYNAEQAVSKHFEESLRRAKEKQLQAAWTVNTIPSSQQTAYQQQCVRSNHITSDISPIVSDECNSSELAVKHVSWPQNKGGSFTELNLINETVKHPEHISGTQKIDVTANAMKIVEEKQIHRNESGPSNESHTVNSFKSKMELTLTSSSFPINQKSVGVIVKHDTLSEANSLQLAQSNIEKVQFHQLIDQKSLPLQIVQLSPLLNTSRHSRIQDSQHQTIFLNTQTKPKVSSPAPSKIYGRPGSNSRINQISTNPLKIVSQTQSKIPTDPPPAHIQSQQVLSSHDLHASLKTNCFPILSHSPGILLQPPSPTNTFSINSSLHVQSKPLDLGISARSRSNNRTILKQSKVDEQEFLCTSLSTKSAVMSFVPQDHRSNNTNSKSLEGSKVTSNHMDDLHSLHIHTNITEKCHVDCGSKSKAFILNGISDRTSDIQATDAHKIHLPTVEPFDDDSGDDFIRAINTNAKQNSVQSASETTTKSFFGFQKSSSQANAPRHLKKAWLQRHNTAEDCESSVSISKLNSDTFSVNSTTMKKVTDPLIPSLSNGVKKGPDITSSVQYQSEKRVKDKKNYSSGSEQSSDQSGHRRSIPKSKRRKLRIWKKLERKKNQASDLDEIASEGIAPESEDSNMEKISENSNDNDQDKQERNALCGDDNNLNASVQRENARKRGRRPKYAEDNINTKKRKVINPKNSLGNTPLSQLKKTGEHFLQDGPCFEVAPKLVKCRECRWTSNQRSKNTSNIFCRFYAFRKLRYTKTGQLAMADFCDPSFNKRRK